MSNSYSNNYSILESVNECAYNLNIRDYVANIILECSKAQPKCKFFKVTRNYDLIIVIHYYVNTSFKSRNYEIPILIYLLKNFPYEAPELYLERTKDTGVNPKNPDIDPNSNRIITLGIKNWSTYSTISGIIAELELSFNKNFPIFKSTTNKTTFSDTDYSNIKPTNNILINNNNLGNNNNNNNLNLYNNTTNTNIYNSNLNNNVNYGIKIDGNNIGNKNFGFGNNTTNTNTSVSISSDKYGFSTTVNNDKYNINSNMIGNPEVEIKKILIEEIKKGIESNIKEELKKLNSQETKLKNFKAEFESQIKKYEEFNSNKSNLFNQITNIIKDIELEINTHKTFILDSKDETINSENYKKFIKISNQKILRVVALEATVEDYFIITKKAYEKGVLSFNESVTINRNLSKEIFKLKYYRDKLLK